MNGRLGGEGRDAAGRGGRDEADGTWQAAEGLACGNERAAIGVAADAC